MELRELILDAFQATSIILVFVTLLFSIKYPTLVSILQMEEPAGSKAKSRLKKTLITHFVTDAIPLLFLSIISFYMLLPLAINVICSDLLTLWSSDILPLAYIAITIWVMMLLIWIIILTYRLLVKIHQIK